MCTYLVMMVIHFNQVEEFIRLYNLTAIKGRYASDFASTCKSKKLKFCVNNLEFAKKLESPTKSEVLW